MNPVFRRESCVLWYRGVERLYWFRKPDVAVNIVGRDADIYAADRGVLAGFNELFCDRQADTKIN